MGDVFKDRTMGSSATSIGTHLALETIFTKKIKLYDEAREFTPVDINKYDHHVYNLYTIVRNIVNSVTTTKVKEDILLDKNFIKVLKLELANIAKYYKNCNCKPHLLYPDYTKIYKGYNTGKETGDTVNYREHNMIRAILDKLDHKEKIVSINDGKGYKIPNTVTGNILITTNLPVDLFNNKGRVDLLESHTGKVRNKYMFNSKYHSVGKEDLSHLPFVEDLLYLLGDKTIVVPMGIKVRRSVLELSKTMKWKATTTREKVMNDIARVPELVTILSKFKRMYI